MNKAACSSGWWESLTAPDRDITSCQGCKETWEQALCLDGCLGSCTGKASPRGYLSPDLNEEAEQTMLRSGESISGSENSMCKGLMRKWWGCLRSREKADVTGAS